MPALTTADRNRAHLLKLATDRGKINPVYLMREISRKYAGVNEVPGAVEWRARIRHHIEWHRPLPGLHGQTMAETMAGGDQSPADEAIRFSAPAIY